MHRECTAAERLRGGRKKEEDAAAAKAKEEDEKRLKAERAQTEKETQQRKIKEHLDRLKAALPAQRIRSIWLSSHGVVVMVLAGGDRSSQTLA